MNAWEALKAIWSDKERTFGEKVVATVFGFLMAFLWGRKK